MATDKKQDENRPPTRAERVKLTAEESLKRVREFSKRKDRFVAAVRSRSESRGATSSSQLRETKGAEAMMSSDRRVQMLPAPVGLPRVETGAVQFGDDWPGLFIRGDNAYSLLAAVRQLRKRLAEHPDPAVADALDVLRQYTELIARDVIVGGSAPP
jgi:hypothetical protein